MFRQYTHGHDVILGTSVDTGAPVLLSRQQRSMHLYIPGATGTGKSRLIEHIIRNQILTQPRHECGMILLDPHGSLYDNVLAWCARHRIDRRIVPIDLRRDDYVIGYNLLRQRGQAASSVIIDDLVMALAHVWGANGTDQTPLLARWAAHIFQALYEKGLAVTEAPMLLENPAIRSSLTANLTDHAAAYAWNRVSTFSPKQFEEMIGSTVNRLPRLVRNPTLSAAFGQTQSSLDLRAALDDGSIILVSLATEAGKVTTQDADTFGTVLLTDLWAAARERGKNKPNQKPFYLYLDEFQRFITPDIAETLAEARGFGLHITVGNQFPAQLLDEGDAGEKLFRAIMENARSKVVFQLSDEENLQGLAKWLFRGVMNPDLVKHALYSTKVLSYRKELRTARSQGTSRTEGRSHSSSDSTNQGEGMAIHHNPNAEDSNVSSGNYGHGTSTANSASWADTHSSSITEQIVDVPVLGKELSSVQFRSLDEQLHQAMMVMSAQPRQYCVARLEGMTAPVVIRVPDVPDIHVPPTMIEQYRLNLLAKLPFALPMVEAVRRMDERQQNLLGHAFDDASPEQDNAIVLRRKVREPG